MLHDINTGQTIIPDLDIHPTGVFTILPGPTFIDVEAGQSQLFVVPDPEGRARAWRALSTITRDRLSPLSLHLPVAQLATRTSFQPT